MTSNAVIKSLSRKVINISQTTVKFFIIAKIKQFFKELILHSLQIKGCYKDLSLPSLKTIVTHNREDFPN